MSTLTIRLPEAKHARLRHLAESRGVSMNKLMEELATVALAQNDTEIRFRAMAAKGDARRGQQLLEKLDTAFARPRR
ncbi:MAG: ribbon-helix-helix protein, CopG family [Bryobacteraceae bacterium]|nr:ribbon-helix-helix protein, CopG family [Bryobacteraceae bacterium]